MEEKEIYRLIDLARDNQYDVCIWGAGKLGRTVGYKTLKNMDISVDYYCDLDDCKENTTIIDSIKCKNITYLIENTNKTVCFLMLGNQFIEHALELANTYNIGNIVTINDLLKIKDVQSQYYPFLNDKVCVYTCITNGYDELREPIFISDKIDYYLISETEPPIDSVYNWINVNDIVPKNITNPIHKNRFCKMHPHLIFKEYRKSVYIDGNINIKSDITELFDKLGKTGIGVSGGYLDCGFYDHGIRGICLGADKEEIIINQMNKYYLEGMPDEFGIFLCNVIFREHNNPRCIELMEMWWSEFNKYSKRDQLSFPYVIWKAGYSREDVLVVSELINEKQYNNSLWEYTGKHLVTEN